MTTALLVVLICAAALSLIAGGTVSASAARAISTTSRQTTSPPVRHATLLPKSPADFRELSIGSVVPLHEVGAIAFATAGIGYALGGPLGYAYPLKTTDAGRSWRVDGAAFFLPTADAPASVSEIVAMSSMEAYAYGGPDGGSAVDVTVDGGAQWWSTYPGQGLMAMSSQGSDLWALVAGSTTSSAVNAQSTVWLYVSNDGGRSWTYRSSLSGILGWEADLVRPGASTAFALVKSYRNDVPGDEHVTATSDSGRTWAIRSDPCNKPFSGYAVDWTERLAGSSSSSLWLFCGSQPSTGMQVKLVERSNDGAGRGRSSPRTRQVSTFHQMASHSLVLFRIRERPVH
jgi:hypothetical protein